MSVSSVKFFNIEDQKAKTKKGNEYSQTNTMKTIYPLFTTGLACTSLLLIKNGNVKASTSAIKAAFKNNPGKTFGNLSMSFVEKITIGFVFGSIVDWIINNSRRKDADKLAEKKTAPKPTNLGKIIGSTIGLGFLASAIALRKNLSNLTQVFLNNKSPFIQNQPEMILKQAEKQSNLLKQIVKPFFTASVIYPTIGFYIDSKINKTRNSNKA